MRLRDSAFQYAFSRLFVYNILWEDTEVDERFLGLREDSRVLGISGAGCGIATMLSKHPTSIDAVDINHHHLAMTALKVAAATRARSYSEFYDLCGRGWAAQPRSTLRALTKGLPAAMERYWDRHSGRFSRSALHEGMTARLIGEMRRLTGIDAEWLTRLCELAPEERTSAIDEWFEPVLARASVRLLLESPIHLMSMGINFTQRDRIVETEGQNMVEFLLAHLKKVASTDLRRNWFAWYSVAGRYNHDDPEAGPPYLRRDRFEASRKSPTRVNYRNENFFDVLGRSAGGSYSHYTLCDMPDWLPAPMQKQLLREIFRTSRDGAIVLYRTVEDDCMVERHGEERRFVPLREETALASVADRSRQYRHVRLYQVAH